MVLRGLLKYIAPRAFDDGLHRCNEAGKKLIDVNPVKRFLDLGCGDGSLTMEFAEQTSAEEVYGIEFVDEQRSTAEMRGIICRKQDLNEPLGYESEFFDLILSSQNIEHLHNTRLYLEECCRCLRPGGQVIILTENLASWVNILSLIPGWQPFSTTNINGWSAGNPLTWHRGQEYDEKFIDQWRKTGVSGTVGHVRLLAYYGLLESMKLAGFTDVCLSSRGYLPLWGVCSDVLCAVDRRHGHFLIGTGKRPH